MADTRARPVRGEADREPVLAVRGEADREVEPEIAVCTVTVAVRDRDRAAALHRLTERYEQLRNLLDGHAAAIERRETSGLRIYPEMKKTGERVSGYRGEISTVLTVTDFAVLGDLVLHVADQDQVSVFGPEWRLRPDSPVHGDARRAAIADAIARARDYADALGSVVLGLELLADSGLGGGQRAGHAVSLGFMARDASQPLDLEPQRQLVHAEVEARFRISAPTILNRRAG